MKGQMKSFLKRYLLILQLIYITYDQCSDPYLILESHFLGLLGKF